MTTTPCSPDYDTIIIGAGLGGLTTAVLLAKSGQRVCVLEQDHQVGGYLAGFSRKGFHFSTSIHWLNQCDKRGIAGRIFNFIAPDAPEAPPQYTIRRLKGDTYDYTLTCHPDDLKEQLIKDFPHEIKGIRRFFKAAKTVGIAFKKSAGLFRDPNTMPLPERALFGLRALKSMLPFLRYVPYSAEKGLAKFFKDPDLKKIFCAEEDLISCLTPIGWAYTGDFQTPPTHGSRVFPDWLSAIFQQETGKLFLNAEVQKVLIEEQTATGVEVLINKQPQTITAHRVVCAADIESLYRKMLPPDPQGQDFLDRLEKAEMYSSSVTIYLGLDCDPCQLGLDKTAVFLTRDDITRREQNNSDPEKCSINVLTPSLTDPSMAPEGKGTMMIFVAAEMNYADYWHTERGTNGEFIRGKAYREFKKKYADILLQRVEEKLAPELRQHIEVCEIATPITFHRYTKNRGGTMMGARPGMKNMKAKVAGYHTHLKNLYIAGHWAEYGGGVAPTVRSAVNTTLFITKQSNPSFFKTLTQITDGD